MRGLKREGAGPRLTAVLLTLLPSVCRQAAASAGGRSRGGSELNLDSSKSMGNGTWPWRRASGPFLRKQQSLRAFGHARYPGNRPLPTWDEMEEGGHLGAHCDPAGNTAVHCGESLVCRRGLCRHCEVDSECPSLHHCVRKALSESSHCRPIPEKAWARAFTDPFEFLCTLAIFFASALAAAAGTGGGGMFVPLLVSLSGLKADKAVPLSQCMILCGSVVNLAVFLSQRHPKARPEPVIDYNCVVLMEPMLCLGVTIGVMVNQICPEWLLLLLLCWTLGLALWRTASKGVRQLRGELAAEASASQKPASPTPRSEVVITRIESWRAHLVLHDFLELTNRKAWQVILTVVIWLVMLASSFHGIGVCTGKFALFLLQVSGLLSFCTFIAARRIRKEAAPVDAAVAEGPVDWTGGPTSSGSGVVVFPLAAFGAGFLGGLLGLGGGIVMGPVLLEVGMHSEAVQATTAVFVFLSSSLATIQFARLRQHVWHYALWYSAVTVAATVLGQKLCQVLVRQKGRYSLITLSIAGVLLASLCALSVIGLAHVREDFRMGRQMWFSMEHLCNKGSLGIVAVDILPAQKWPSDLG